MFEVSCDFLLVKQSNVRYTCYEIMTNVLNRKKKDDIPLLHSDRNSGNDIARSCYRIEMNDTVHADR